jgi:hypothetical protein
MSDIKQVRRAVAARILDGDGMASRAQPSAAFNIGRLRLQIRSSEQRSSGLGL